MLACNGEFTASIQYSVLCFTDMLLLIEAYPRQNLGCLWCLWSVGAYNGLGSGCTKLLLV